MLFYLGRGACFVCNARCSHPLLTAWPLALVTPDLAVSVLGEVKHVSAAITCCVVIVITWWALCWGHSLRLLHQGRASRRCGRSLCSAITVAPCRVAANFTGGNGLCCRRQDSRGPRATPRASERATPRRPPSTSTHCTRVLCIRMAVLWHTHALCWASTYATRAPCAAPLCLLCAVAELSFAGRPRV
jgi:hypothetical protein